MSRRGRRYKARKRRKQPLYSMMAEYVACSDSNPRHGKAMRDRLGIIYADIFKAWLENPDLKSQIEELGKKSGTIKMKAYSFT